MEKARTTKTSFARTAGISRLQLYYTHKQPEKDWIVKQRIEEVLHNRPSYGHKRIAIALGMNKKRIRRVMHLFGIKPYRRRGRKFRKTKVNSVSFPNLLPTESPQYSHHIWASDFTHISFHGRWIYPATIVDLFTREVVGFSVLTTHSIQLVMNAFLSAVKSMPRWRNWQTHAPQERAGVIPWEFNSSPRH